VSNEPAEPEPRLADPDPAVVELTEPDDLDAVVRLFERIWGQVAEPPLSRELLVALTFEGGYLSGIRGGDGDLVAASVGLFGLSPTREWLLHSHITGALPEGRRRHAGLALKRHQRAWCLDRGIATVQWTFDPLVRRNAHFNLVKLAADAVGYLPDFYGEMTDALNAGHASDRMLIRWNLRSASSAAAAGGSPRVVQVPPDVVVAVGEGPDGGPLVAPVPAGAVAALVATPPDVEALRTLDAGLARAWRSAQREALTGLLGSGWSVVGFADRRSYLLTSS
jgi:predicted GNAT superfamily acetyltransferase